MFISLFSYFADVFTATPTAALLILSNTFHFVVTLQLQRLCQADAQTVGEPCCDVDEGAAAAG